MTDLLTAIERILWEEWDPIGVNDSPEAFGEYDSYALQICGMLQTPTKPSVHEIAAYLEKVRTKFMGLNAASQHDRAIAAKLADL